MSEAQKPIFTILTHCIRVYSILIHTGKGGGEERIVEPERRFGGQQFTKLGRNTNMADCISSLINTCRKVPLQVIFR